MRADITQATAEDLLQGIGSIYLIRIFTIIDKFFRRRRNGSLSILKGLIETHDIRDRADDNKEYSDQPYS
jgi:hypothetical protein